MLECGKNQARIATEPGHYILIPIEPLDRPVALPVFANAEFATGEAVQDRPFGSLGAWLPFAMRDPPSSSPGATADGFLLAAPCEGGRSPSLHPVRTFTARAER